MEISQLQNTIGLEKNDKGPINSGPTNSNLPQGSPHPHDIPTPTNKSPIDKGPINQSDSVHEDLNYLVKNQNPIKQTETISTNSDLHYLKDLKSKHPRIKVGKIRIKLLLET